MRVFIQSVKVAGGIEKFALTEAGKGNTEGIANLTMNYWCIYLIIVLGGGAAASGGMASCRPKGTIPQRGGICLGASVPVRLYDF